MLRNYLKMAMRSLLRQKFFGAINIMGLAVGMACSLLVLQYVRYELTYDQRHLKSGDVYRVQEEIKRPDGRSQFRPHLSGALREAMAVEIPEVKKVTRLWSHGGVTVTAGERQRGVSVSVVDPDFFDIFDFRLVDGTDPGKALAQPGTILIMDMGRNIAPLFGDEDPVGKTVTLYDGIFEGEYIIAGVLKDRTTNEVFRWDFITTHLPRKFPMRTWDQWHRNARMSQVITQVQKDTDIGQFEEKLNTLLEKNMGLDVVKTNRYHLQKFDRIRLYSEVDFGIQSRRSIQHIYLYGSIALLLVFVAVVNYINLTTARAGRRAREIGIRKVTGAYKGQLIRQFLVEAMLVTLFAGLLAWGLAYLALPTFNQIAWGTTLGLDDFLWVLGFSLIVGLCAGIYPAFHLSRQEPVRILKGGGDLGRSSLLRKTLVVGQFAISTFLIVAALSAYRQLSYMHEREVGFDAEGLVSMNILSHGLWSREDGERVKAEFMRHPNIIAATRQGWQNLMNTGETTVTNLDNGQAYSVYQFHTDDDFLETYRVGLKMGHNFRTNRRDSEFIVNEAAVDMLGWKEPIGKSLRIGQREGLVVGVIEDFHFQSFHHPIRPLILRNWGGNYLHLRIKYTDVAETIAFMKETWKKLEPKVAFSYQFVDDRMAGSYRADKQEAAISFFAAGMAIFVAILGLIGLTAYATEQRAKEIGIRKVLGASVPNLVALLTHELFRLVILANVVAWPLAYYLIRSWLEQFAYRIALGPGIFLVGSICVATLALLTIFSLAIRAAYVNPIETLRSE